MGTPDGAAVGDVVGKGVGAPGTYVGDRVGIFEGTAVGLTVGLGVGLPGK